MFNSFLKSWHNTLRLTRQTSASWHRARILEELRERRNARTPLEKLSETSDVLFSISRARHDGFAIRLRPSVFLHPLAYGYMLAKFTSRSPPLPLPPPSPIPSSPSGAPRIVGLYGIPGCGKSFLMNELKKELGQDDFAYFNGSEQISEVTPCGLLTFDLLDESMKAHCRQKVIEKIKAACIEGGKVGIVTGHYMFWPEGEAAKRVLTQVDLDTYTHILYLKTSEKRLLFQRSSDKTKDRPKYSGPHLTAWQATEIKELREFCYANNILFAYVCSNKIDTKIDTEMSDQLLRLLRDIRHHDEEHNLAVAERILDEALATHPGQLESVLVMDADRTLSAEDTGRLFWNIESRLDDEQPFSGPLEDLFGSKMGYSYTAFRQAILLYEESACNDARFNSICNKIAQRVTLYPQMRTFLDRVARNRDICPLIVTCLSKTVQVIGGRSIADGYVVTASVKKALVTRAKDVHRARRVIAIGDSPLGLPMLTAADRAFVVVGKEAARSKSMDCELHLAIVNDGLRAQQILLPSSSTPPRLDTTQLPVADFESADFLESIIAPCALGRSLQIHHTTNSTVAKLLMTPIRDASNSGPPLRNSHFQAGAHLAGTLLSELIGVEEVEIAHVQGHKAIGYQLRGKGADIDSCSDPEDVKQHHLEGNSTIILVDTVINNGDTVVVVQEKTVALDSPLQSVVRPDDLTIVALRLSENIYTGSGGTDTGNRLFNTTYLP
ncbi:hypothetical protein BDW74DRAFT_171803 [Aspergillus multicolor]|uniref:uncharacterized protein n=1 Tax=Aspergillus multicolor TaxID=41759 RepID=UPI003CCDE656